MPDIKDSVGEGGSNKVHDVALLQAMLSVVKNAKGVAYLPDYDGKYSPVTKAAITAFQTDQGLIAKPGAKADPAAKADAGALEKVAFVDKGTATLTKLVAALPAAYKDMMIIENTSTVYLPGSDIDAKASAAAIHATADLEPAFRGKVAQLVNLMYSTHKIVLSVTGSGGHRTFDAQAKIVNTKAGPGESNHNFGRAVDIGFKGFTWIKGGGTKTDDWWLNTLTNNEKDAVGKAKAKELWNARDAIAVKGPPGLFNTILPGDDIHLQSFDDHLPNDRALADLLNRAGKMKWEAEHKVPRRRYNSDLGFGGKMFNVGTAAEVWAQKATVTKAMIAQAKTDALMKAAKLKGPAAVKAVVPVKEADIKASDISAIQKALRDDFVAAEAKWLDWKAVP